MLRNSLAILLASGAFSLAQAQFSSRSRTSWMYRTGSVAIGTSSQYTSNGTPKLHIDKGFLRIGNSTSSTDRDTNMLRIGDGDYLRIGEWHRNDMMSFKAVQGF